MILIAAFLRATALVIAGYFVWFASSRTEDGRLKTLGKYIGVWCFAFAVVLAVAGIAGAFLHAQGRGFHGRPGMYGGMMHGRMGMMQGGMMSPRMGMMGPGMGMTGPMMGPMGMHRPGFMFRGRGAAETPEKTTPAPPEKATPEKTSPEKTGPAAAPKP